MKPEVRLPRMRKGEIESLIKDERICRIAFRGKKVPYLIPFQYALIDGRMYFHFTGYGRKISLLESGEPVCVEIESFPPEMSNYRFVVITGLLEIVRDQAERREAIDALAETGRRSFSDSFLAAHGFRKEEGWSSLTPDKPMIIVKLTNVVEQIGLKSP